MIAASADRPRPSAPRSAAGTRRGRWPRPRRRHRTAACRAPPTSPTATVGLPPAPGPTAPAATASAKTVHPKAWTARVTPSATHPRHRPLPERRRTSTGPEAAATRPSPVPAPPTGTATPAASRGTRTTFRSRLHATRKAPRARRAAVAIMIGTEASVRVVTAAKPLPGTSERDRFRATRTPSAVVLRLPHRSAALARRILVGRHDRGDVPRGRHQVVVGGRAQRREGLGLAFRQQRRRQQVGNLGEEDLQLPPGGEQLAGGVQGGAAVGEGDVDVAVHQAPVVGPQPLEHELRRPADGGVAHRGERGQHRGLDPAPPGPRHGPGRRLRPSPGPGARAGPGCRRARRRRPSGPTSSRWPGSAGRGRPRSWPGCCPTACPGGRSGRRPPRSSENWVSTPGGKVESGRQG